MKITQIDPSGKKRNKIEWLQKSSFFLNYPFHYLKYKRECWNSKSCKKRGGTGVPFDKIETMFWIWGGFHRPKRLASRYGSTTLWKQKRRNGTDGPTDGAMIIIFTIGRAWNTMTPVSYERTRTHVWLWTSKPLRRNKDTRFDSFIPSVRPFCER